MRLGLSRRVKKAVLIAAVFSAVTGWSLLRAQSPATQPATDATPSTQPSKPANVSPEAKADIDALTKAYGSLTSLYVEGTLNFDANIDGRPRKENGSFTGSFQSPNFYRHEMKDDISIGSTGEKEFAYVPSKKMYVLNDAFKSRTEFTESPTRAGRVLEQQNPSLFFALSADAGKALLFDATDVTKLSDEKLGDQTFTALSIKKSNNDQVALIDPNTHLVRQLRIDVAKSLAAQGAPNVKSATVTFDYPVTRVNPTVKPDQFAWAPPEGTKDEATARREMIENAAADLVNKPAPAFSLPGLDDKKVSLADLKGSVVVLDFWATWCMPCRISLPHLDKLYQSKKGEGLKAYAINQEEDKATVQEFVNQTKLTIPALLDEDGSINKIYASSGLPTTVVIGKDGVVKKVVFGFAEGDDSIQKAVEAELAKK